MLNILIGIPSFDNVPTDFAISLANMTKSVSAQIDIFNFRSPNLAYSRETIADKCLYGGYSHLLFLDSDMTFPSYTLSRMLGHQKDCVMCNYSRRFEPEFPTVIPKERSGNDLVEVKGGGLGVCLIKRNCLEALSKPRFSMDWDNSKQEYTPEDLTFYNALKGKGISTYMDKTLSKEIGHIGQKKYMLPIS